MPFFVIRDNLLLRLSVIEKFQERLEKKADYRRVFWIIFVSRTIWKNHLQEKIVDF